MRQFWDFQYLRHLRQLQHFRYFRQFQHLPEMAEDAETAKDTKDAADPKDTDDVKLSQISIFWIILTEKKQACFFAIYATFWTRCSQVFKYVLGVA